ncbi:uncharacterized protein rusc1 isoform X2 [Alosa sapidissima]|uniref:uncharacterized protein rusc1 isoform X2 n=1 Tax=Alosa sapidissima TaxID=34773 RepID=UPI001C0839F2|nr:uncharacterized protein rusc1 isoform X2 [Alosa sapidissima]
MHSSSRPSVPARPRRFETNRQADPKTHGPGARREDKNMNTSLNTATSSTRRVTRGPPESSRFRSGAQAGRNTTVKPTVARQQKNTTQSSAANPKPKSRQAVSNLPPVVTDPNCNEPSLPCLCCDGRSPQDSNSLFNHNHNNNNTITMRQQLQLQQPSIPRKEEEDWQRKPVVENKAETNPDSSIEVTKEAVKGPKGPVAQVDKKKEEILVAEDKERVGEEDSDVEVPVAPGVDPNGNNQVSVEDEDDGDDDDDDDTLVPSCCDCPASMLEFSLSSSTSSSSTSISSCSDLELDCPDTYSLSSQDQDAPERYPSARSSTAQPHILPLDPNVPSGHPMSPCSPDEGYPSAPCSPSSDFSDCKEETEQFGTKPGLLNFLDSMDELGKMDRFYHVVQVVCWELDDEMGLRDRLDHLYRLEKVNRQVKLFHLAKLQEAGLDLEDEDISDVLDEMGNIDIPWKLYKGESSCESQEFSDAGVDVSGPSDLDDPAVPDSLSSSPLEPPPRPPKPPVRHVSAQPETHTYINIEQSSPVVSSSASPTSSAVGSPSPSSHLIKKPIPDPPPLPPPPSQAIPYFTLYSASSCAPSPTPPIPPPRTRHLARREALRCAQLQAEQSPMSLPPPTSKPPPLPPPPALPSPPKIPPPPPSLPPPPSFHALDVEIQKLLALAGLTQAELLKLSPELGVCVSGVLDSSQGEEEEKSIVAPGPEPQPARLSRSGENTKIGGDRVSKYEPKGMKGAWIDGWGEAEKFGEHRGTDMSPGNDTYGDRTREAKRDALRTTSFTEMARRRKQNGSSTNSSCSCGYGVNTSLSTDAYYSTEISNANSTNATFDNFDYSSELPDTPPPPPPRPLPPCPPVTSKPPELPPVMPCTVPANASRPDRFDWLIAFTPDTEASPWELRKCTSGVVLPKVTLGSKVTTFKELRNRSKQSSLPAPAEPEPDPTVTTPDPDFLYNLKWRRGKNGGDGSQWEYTSQAEASFLMPPPTPASLSLFREMRHLTLEGDGQAEPHPSQRIGCSASEGNLWNIGAERAGDGKRREEEEEVQVRGRADGGRTLESRTTVSSPPLSLARPQAPPSAYFLHSYPMPPPLLTGRNSLYRAQPGSSARGQAGLETKTCPTSDCVSQTYSDSLYCSDLNHNVDDSVFLNEDINSDIDSLYLHNTVSKSNLDSLYCSERPTTNKIDIDSHSNMNSLVSTDLSYNVDSLYYPQNKGKTSDSKNIGEDICNDGNTTPYKNIEMLKYAKTQKAPSYPLSNKQINSDSQHVMTLHRKSDSGIPWDLSLDQMTSLGSARVKQPPPLPTCYLYHPKNCPLHKGAPPRLSPVGAISPPHRSGLPGPGLDASGLCSPLFPRSHTLPALAAPLYYPYLYTPPIRAPLQEPPTPNLPQQAPPRPSCALTVRSLSFAGSVQKAGAWMGDDDDASSALRGSSLSSQCLQEKRALVSAVSLAVEAILAQFSSSRTLVQKALSGDSSINPTLGRLVLQCLCPSLRSLLSDGLKPHQSDLIAGRRPNSPWGLVQASTKPGPRTQGLHSLQARVADLPQLRQSGHRFNAFLLGLLNTKLLDYWISHLQTCSDVLLTYYRPNSFMRLSLTSCQPLFEELLLLLQPLSLLTFNLDLLFQHHHFDPASPADPLTNHSPDLTSPPNQELGFGVSPWGPVQGHRLESVSEHDVGRPESCPSNQNTALSSLAKPLAGGVVQSSCRGPVPVSAFASKGETSPQLQWVREKDIAPPPEESEYSSLSQQAGQVLHQGWGAVVRWGERLGHNLNSLGSSSEDSTTGTSPDSRRGPDILRSQPQEEASSWANSVAVPWGLERLFGASKNSCNPPVNTPQARRPSQWLAPSVSVLARMVSGSQPSLPDRIHVEAKQAKPAEKKREETQDKPKPTRAVRTLCDHSGSGMELTFQKGEELIVLGSVDQDWIRCRQGDKEGLVPIGYTSLIM